jgi:AraC family transcriptional regulator of adaptative response/methylated-DNA-[protein]-cysteine methyltransferase
MIIHSEQTNPKGQVFPDDFGLECPSSAATSRQSLAQAQLDYRRIESAINFIATNFRDQPSLNEIAAASHVSPYHFQRLFSKWVGISPKKFMQFISINYAKDALAGQGATLLDTAYHSGLSGPGRLHDLFVKIEGMTPGAFKQGGAGLSIKYSFADSPFGTLLIASTPTGVCHMAFEDVFEVGLERLRSKFPNASMQRASDQMQQDALFIFQHDGSPPKAIKLHLSGTPFQVKVWEALLKIPMGSLATYGDIAAQIGAPAASRAVGTATGSNPIAFLIPCHRVIKKTGQIGGYMWGASRKQTMIAWEGAKVHA